jgi:hypothetical protein
MPQRQRRRPGISDSAPTWTDQDLFPTIDELASRLAGSFSVPVSKGPEPCADILYEQFRLFHGREMPAARHLGPTLHIEESLGSFARRLTDILRKECESRRHVRRAGPLLHPLLNPIQGVCIRVVVDAPVPIPFKSKATRL